MCKVAGAKIKGLGRIKSRLNLSQEKLATDYMYML